MAPKLINKMMTKINKKMEKKSKKTAQKDKQDKLTLSPATTPSTSEVEPPFYIGQDEETIRDGTAAAFYCFHPSAGTPANEPKDGMEANPPTWPNDDTNVVKIVSPNQTDELETLKAFQDPSTTAPMVTTTVDINTKKVIKRESGAPVTTFRPQETHFSERRTAIMFREGTYTDFELQIGYYVQAMGVGKSAKHVVFEGKKHGIYCPAYNKDQSTLLTEKWWMSVGSSLDTFWRSAENFTNNTDSGLTWAVSQAAPLRRIQAQNGIQLSDGGYSSGGHLANARINGGKLSFGSQQQFCCRNVSLPSPSQGQNDDAPELANWSTVFVNCDNAPTTPSEKVTNHRATVVVEKPFIAMDEDNQTFNLHVPQPRTGAIGADLDGEFDEIRSFDRVYVAKAKVADYGAMDYDVARKVNKALAQGKDVVLSPGMYYLTETIVIPSPDQVLLGIGMATLVAPTDGTPCVQVAPFTPGVRIAGITFEASRLNENHTGVASFLEWGQEGMSSKDTGLETNPGVMSDVFCRVGGSSLDRGISTDVMIRIHSGNVLGDNLWLWRADHMALRKNSPGVKDEQPNFPRLDYHQTTLGEAPVKTGLQVFGDNVAMHGLAVEHCTQDQVQWYGENGQVWFYQCELPYDVTQDFADQGYLGFRVAPSVQNMQLGGAGVYSNFRDHDVNCPTAMMHPHATNPEQVTNLFTKFLDNIGLIQAVVTNGNQTFGGPAEPNSSDPSRYSPGDENKKDDIYVPPCALPPINSENKTGTEQRAVVPALDRSARSFALIQSLALM